MPLISHAHPLLTQTATWLDYLVSVVLISPCALPVIAVVILCVAMIIRQARHDRTQAPSKKQG